MEKRKYKRIKTRQFAKICGKLGVLNDMSHGGVQISTSLMPKKRKVDISFEVQGKLVMLDGSVQWIRRKSSLNSLNKLGVLIENPSLEFRQFVNTLH